MHKESMVIGGLFLWITFSQVPILPNDLNPKLTYWGSLVLL